uniref:Origin recognition complex subunit 2 n=2 Tax=Chrysotila carterae TaxID=13221 RepID=A0A7S4B6P2_CHRCT|mmetsp:Transcript_32581/g.68554  ORF Transcript_32581/g.68554 Transcript_32581/m.68554 type:complete len:289 (+) Transcript_32581:749-1615(+)
MSAKRASAADKLQSAPHGCGSVYRNVLRLLATRECESEEDADSEFKEMPTVSSQRTSSRLQHIYDEQRLGEIAIRDDVCAAALVKSKTRCSDQVLPRTLYIVVHNIDGVALRNETEQSLLAALAALPQVKLIASCSHRNAAAIWDGQQARQFNWAWIQADTAAPYVNEARESVHDLLGRLQDETECSEGRSAQIVLSALTTSARRVFSELLAHSLEAPASAGLAFSEIFHRVKSKLICTSEAALKGHITEFIDHHLVRTRRSDSGRQCYYATLPKSVAIQIVEQAVSK